MICKGEAAFDDMQGASTLMIYQTLLRFGLDKKEPKLKWIQFWFFLAEWVGATRKADSAVRCL